MLALHHIGRYKYKIPHTGSVGKKRDHMILDPLIFSGKIRKNRKSQEEYFVGKVFRKLRKNTKKLGKILKKISKNSFEKIENQEKQKTLGKIPKIRKNTSET